ncbi:MAG: carbohydrate porin, partial [Phycisphaerae bacterium]|nr:carbohydrate porin [Phycisphaerae bacterium]
LDYVKFPRAWLADHGVNIHASLLPIYQNITRGGLDEEDDDKLTTSYDLQTYLGTSKLGLWKGGHGLVRAEGKWGDDGVNPATGAVIPVNFDAVVPNNDDVKFELTEWWYAQAFFDDRFEILGGMWDIARFYDISPFSGPYHYRFINAHMFFNSVLLPYAPYNLLGGLVTVKPAKWLTITTSISDPNSSSNDVDWFDESDFDLLHQWQFMARPFGKQGMYSVGVAYRDKEQATIKQDPASPGTETDQKDWAFYLNLNQWLYQNPDNPHQAIGVFGRFGASDGDVNIIERHYSLGLSFDGMIPFRPKDVFGMVGWYNNFSDDLTDTPLVDISDSSKGFEAYYRIQVMPWLQVSPNVQYLIDPGIVEGNDDSLILGLRTLIHF